MEHVINSVVGSLFLIKICLLVGCGIHTPVDADDFEAMQWDFSMAKHIFRDFPGKVFGFHVSPDTPED